MQQVAGSKVQVAPREQAAQKAEEKPFDPWTFGLPAIIIGGWLIIGAWIATVLFLVQGAQWLGPVWFR